MCECKRPSSAIVTAASQRRSTCSPRRRPKTSRRPSGSRITSAAKGSPCFAPEVGTIRCFPAPNNNPADSSAPIRRLIPLVEFPPLKLTPSDLGDKYSQNMTFADDRYREVPDVRSRWESVVRRQCFQSVFCPPTEPDLEFTRNGNKRRTPVRPSHEIAWKSGDVPSSGSA